MKSLSPSELIEYYLSLEQAQIDTALSEKVKEGLVIRGAFDWTDVGSYSDLYNVGKHDQDGNILTGEEIHTKKLSNSYIRNLENKPVAVIGLDNVVVVNSPNGLLVINKNYSQDVATLPNKYSHNRAQTARTGIQPCTNSIW